MEITNDELIFDSEDRALWRAFLLTRAGARLLPKLIESAPLLLEAGDTNAIMIRTGKVSGFQESVRVLLSLAGEEALPNVTNKSDHYPAPEDDAAWEDGQKIKLPQE